MASPLRCNWGSGRDYLAVTLTHWGYRRGGASFRVRLRVRTSGFVSCNFLTMRMVLFSLLETQMEIPMFFKRSLIALALCAGVAGCAANPNPDVTFFLPGTDIPIAGAGPSWDMAVGPSPTQEIAGSFSK